MIGTHNIQNATAAASLAFTIGLPEKYIKLGLYNFKGVQRRFSHLFNHHNISFYDDYAHHPTEIYSVLEGIKKVSNRKKITSIFQPHRFSRVNFLKKEFSKSFKFSDRVILCPVYAAGEKSIKKFDLVKFGKLIAKNSKVQVIIIKDEKKLKKFFKNNLIKNEIIIGMGAGSISSWIRNLKQFL